MTVFNMKPLYISSSVQELVKDHCGIADIDKCYSFHSYLEASNNLYKQAAQYKIEGDLETSYIYSIRFCSLLLEKLPKHPEYSKEKNRVLINSLKSKANQIIVELESIKSILDNAYVKKREEEKKQRELERIKQEKIKKIEEENKRKLEEERKKKEEEQRLKEIEDELNQTIIKEVENKKKKFFLPEELKDLLRQEALEYSSAKQQQPQQNDNIEERADILSPVPASNINQVPPVFNSADLDFLETNQSIVQQPILNIDDIENIARLNIGYNNNSTEDNQFESKDLLFDPSFAPPPEKEKPPPKLPPIPSTDIPLSIGYPELDYSQHEYPSPPIQQQQISPIVQTSPIQQQVDISISYNQQQQQQQQQQQPVIQSHIQSNLTPPTPSSVQHQLYQQQKINQSPLIPPAIPPPYSIQSPPMPLPYTQQFKTLPDQYSNNIKPQYQIPNNSSIKHNTNNNPYITQVATTSNNINKSVNNNQSISNNNSSPLVTVGSGSTSTSTNIKKPNIDSDEASKKYSKLRNINVDFKMFHDFMKLAEYNTSRKIETCGILSGTLSNDVFTITTIIIPKQEGTTDTCNTIEEHEIFEYQLEHDLLTLGWVHTHPTQECFLSAVDLHTHCSYQYLLQEAIAVVIAPRSNPNFGIFRLTDPPGLETVQKCKLKSFHPHPPVNGVPVYTSCNHVNMSNGKFNGKVVDLRTKK